MEEKKTPGANLEKERSIYFLMGFIVVLSSFFVLMEWRSSGPDYSDWQNLTPVFIENEYIGLESQQELPSVIPEELIVEESPDFIYDDYEIVEELDEVESMIELLTDSNLTPSLETIQEELLLREKEIADKLSEDETVYSQADIMPQFPGGERELIRFIFQNTQYPSVALKQRIQGRVWCSLIVNKDGSVSDIKLEQGVYIFLDEEAIRVLRLLPPWAPGKIAGEPVRVKVYLPIVFKI